MQRIVVLLPEPFGPRNPVTRPGWTSKLRLSTATVLPKRLVISRISIIVAVSCPDVVLAVHATGGRPPLVGRAGHRIGSALVRRVTPGTRRRRRRRRGRRRRPGPTSAVSVSVSRAALTSSRAAVSSGVTSSLRTSGSTASLGTIARSSSRATKPPVSIAGSVEKMLPQSISPPSRAAGMSPERQRHELGELGVVDLGEPGEAERRARLELRRGAEGDLGAVLEQARQVRQAELVDDLLGAHDRVLVLGRSTASAPRGPPAAPRRARRSARRRWPPSGGSARRRTPAASRCTRERGRPRRPRWRRSTPRGIRCRARS